MIEESAYDELDRYVNGKMHGEELNGFMQKLGSDNALRNEVEWIKSTMIAMSLSGRTVMKQHIAAAMSGEIESYSPAKNKKSFWKKWWWLIAILALAGAVAVAAYNYLPQGVHNEDVIGSDQLPLGGPGPEASAPVSDSAYFADSCAALDSIMLQKESDSSVKDTVDVEVGVGFNDRSEDDVYNEVTNDGNVAPFAVTGSYAFQDVTWGEGSNKDLAMPVTLNIRGSGPFTYKLDSVLTLNSNYMSAKKMRFRGSGDTILMMDSANNTYTLLRNRGNLPLVKNPKPVSK